MQNRQNYSPLSFHEKRDPSGSINAVRHVKQEQLPPVPSGDVARRPVDNRPAWLSQLDEARGKQVRFGDDSHRAVQDDRSPKHHRAFVVTSGSLLQTNSTAIRQMPLDLDNGLPGILARFGSNEHNEVNFICLINTCAMNTGNLQVHQWLMTTYPEIVAEYIQFDDSDPFQPLQLECAVSDLSAVEDNHGKLTAIVRYWTQYKHEDGKRVVLSFGLGPDVNVNSIIGMPTIRQWGMNICFLTSVITAHQLKVRFSTHFERSKTGLPNGISFKTDDFIRPGNVNSNTPATVLITNVHADLNVNEERLSSAITDHCGDGIATIGNSTTITDDTSSGFLKRTVLTPDFE